MADSLDRAKYSSGFQGGFFESYFLRAHHPDLPYAFWFRYALTEHRDRAQGSWGELWGVFFNGLEGSQTVVKKNFPPAKVSFSADKFHVCLGDNLLCAPTAKGAVHSNRNEISWHLEIKGREEPVFLLPRGWYEKAFPRAKSIVIMPLASFDGKITVNGEEMVVQNWRGSVNHHWGQRYTDEYAWGQVAGFDTHRESFLEAATACLRLGPLRSPRVTPIVLRHRGEEFAFNTFFHLCDSRGSFSEYVWVFRADTRGVRVEGTVSAQREQFVGLTYRNPTGGVKYCLNTQLAACEVRFEDRRNGKSIRETLFTRHRAAFEVVTDRRDHSIPILD